MRSAYRMAAAAACAALAAAGCLDDRSAGATGVGNPTKGSVTVALVATGTPAAGKFGAYPLNPDGSYTIRDAGGTAFTVRTSLANVGRLDISLPEGKACKDADETPCEAGEVRLNGPFVADLLTGSWAPDPGSLRIPVGDYTRLDVRLEAQEKPGNGAPDLGGRSLVMKGTFEHAGRADRPFSIELDFDEEARFQSDSSITVREGINRITVALDIAKWLSQADLTACLADGTLPLDAEGGFTLTGDDCRGVARSIKEDIKASGRLHGEHDED